MSTEIKSVLVERDEGEQTIIACDRGAAMITRLYEDGDVSQLVFNGAAMDKISETWLAYRSNQAKGEINV